MNTGTHHGARSLATLAAGGLLSLAAAIPATAGQAPGVVLPDPYGDEVGTSVPVPRVPVDDDTIEFVQIGLGALGGIALTGAGAVAMRAHRRHHPQLA